MSIRLGIAGVVLVTMALLSTRDGRAFAQDAQGSAPSQPAPSQPPAVPDEPSAAAAREILSAMAKAYADCTSYRDTGTVSTKFSSLGTVSADSFGGERSNRLEFKTAFVRGGSFRFEYSDLDGHAAHKPYIIASDGKTVRSWWHVKPGVETAASLGMAIAGATGVSSGSAHHIPRLLLPEIDGWPLTAVVDPRLDGEETLDGHVCLKLVARHSNGDPWTLWIDKDTHLVRQLFRSHEFADKGFRTEQTTIYKPEVDVTIDPSELAFNPPEAEEPDER